MGEGARARARGVQLEAGGHVTGRRPRYRLTVGMTSPSPDCRGWHFRSPPPTSPLSGGCSHFEVWEWAGRRRVEGVFVAAPAPGFVPSCSKPGPRAVAEAALPRRAPLCERAAPRGGWCRPPAAPSSGGGGDGPGRSRPSLGRVPRAPSALLRSDSQLQAGT